jgi:hypothetical protein
MSRSPNDAVHWRLRAQDARLFAKQGDDPGAISAALEIAYQYARIAKRATVLNKDKARKDI